MPIYLDNNATTPIDPRVLEAMRPAFEGVFGNPASATHAWGWQAEELVKIAREQVAAALECTPEEIIFTATATEANNLALQGLALRSPKRLVYSAIEHKSVLGCAARLGQLGWECIEVAVDSSGLVDLDALSSALQKPTSVVSIIGANNEVGTFQDLAALIDLAHSHNALIHMDLVQGFGKVPLSLGRLGVDLASFSAHKINGPKGVGALFVRRELRPELQPIILGGDHEGGLRAGTLNVPGIVGFGKAAQLATTELEGNAKHCSRLATSLLNQLRGSIPGLALNGHATRRIPGNLSLTFPQIDATQIIAKLASQVALSTTSACLSAGHAGSHVLRALGLDQAQIRSTLRIGVGNRNTEQEVALAGQKIVETYLALKLKS